MAFGASENFDGYSNGDNLNGLNGGTGFAAAWATNEGSGQVAITSSLSESSANSASITGSGSNVEPHFPRTLSSALSDTSSIVKFALRTSSTGGSGGRTFGLTVEATDQVPYAFGYLDLGGNRVAFAVQGSGTDALISGISANTWYYVWMDIDVTNNRARAFASTNPNADPSGSWTSYRSFGSSDTLNRIAINGQTGTFTGTFYIDSIQSADSVSVTVSPSILAASFSAPASTITAVQNVTVSANVLSVVATLPSRSIITGATISPSALSSTFSLPAATVLIADTTVMPGVLTVTASLPSGTVITDQVLTPSPFAAAFSLPSVTVSAVQNATCTPSPLSALFTVLTAHATGAIWENQERASAAALTNQSRPSSTWTNQDRSPS